ncbi:hypothetical protein B2J93_6279 [Marssonina coronariae]|uniref:Uncharacterized protein n=1 Tax=Diplocarpon coronariae TaxID=2795749 RepID=A0A218ZFA8_9HELO|nr:hypothetical protein B2J93_6279 [Marssonina coronariae]
MLSSENNRYWIPNLEISKKVITQEIQYYLGPLAAVRPYTFQGEDGFLITTPGECLTDENPEAAIQHGFAATQENKKEIADHGVSQASAGMKDTVDMIEAICGSDGLMDYEKEFGEDGTSATWHGV